jgi:hypothetical protein
VVVLIGSQGGDAVLVLHVAVLGLLVAEEAAKEADDGIEGFPAAKVHGVAPMCNQPAGQIHRLRIPRETLECVHHLLDLFFPPDLQPALEQRVEFFAVAGHERYALRFYPKRFAVENRDCHHIELLGQSGEDIVEVQSEFPSIPEMIRVFGKIVLMLRPENTQVFLRIIHSQYDALVE